MGRCVGKTTRASRDYLRAYSNTSPGSVTYRVRARAKTILKTAFRIADRAVTSSINALKHAGNTKAFKRVQASRLYRYNPVIMYGNFLRNRSPLFSAAFLAYDNSLGLKPFYLIYGGIRGINAAIQGGIMYGIAMGMYHAGTAFAVAQPIRVPLRVFHATCLAVNAAHVKPGDFMHARRKTIRYYYKKKMHRTLRMHAIIKTRTGIQLNTRSRIQKMLAKQNALIRRNPRWYRVSRIFCLTFVRSAKHHAQQPRPRATSPSL